MDADFTSILMSLRDTANTIAWILVTLVICVAVFIGFIVILMSRRTGKDAEGRYDSYLERPSGDPPTRMLSLSRKMIELSENSSVLPIPEIGADGELVWRKKGFNLNMRLDGTGIWLILQTEEPKAELRLVGVDMVRLPWDYRVGGGGDLERINRLNSTKLAEEFYKLICSYWGRPKRGVQQEMLAALANGVAEPL